MTDGGLQLLLIEDDDIDAEAVRRSIKRIGSPARLYHESDVDAGLHRLRRLLSHGHEHVIILLDLNLPGEDGHGCLRRLHADGRNAAIPVAVLSTSDDDNDRRNAFLNGAAGYFVKPLDGDALDDILRSICAYWTCSRFPPNEHAIYTKGA